MPVTVGVKSCSELGDRLLGLLNSGGDIDDPVKILCIDDVTVRPVHKNVLRASSGYFRQFLLKHPQMRKPIKVPISSVILDLVIEFIYTTRMLTVEIEQLVELYSASHLLQLDELTIQLKEFFLDCMADCIQTDGFLESQRYDDVARFLTIFPLPLGDRGRIRLIELIYNWAEKQSIEHSRIGVLIGRVVTRPPILERRRVSTNPMRPEAAPLLVCKDKMYEITHGRLIELDHPPSAVERLYRGNYAFVVGHEGYVCSSREIAAFDMSNGAPLRTIQVPARWKDWVPALWCLGSHLYGWYENRVYQLTKDRFRRLCRTRDDIEALCVYEHEDDDTLKLCYMNGEGRLSLVCYDGSGQVVSEDPSVPGVARLIGVHENNVIAMTDSAELVVIQHRSVVWRHDFERPFDSCVSCWRNIAVQYSNNNDICVVDVVTHSIRVIPASVGRLTFREFVD